MRKSRKLVKNAIMHAKMRSHFSKVSTNQLVNRHPIDDDDGL